MSTVLYFDIFKHPLRKQELLFLIHNRKITEQELAGALNYLVSKGFLHEMQGYYLPHYGFENINRRIDGEKLAEKSWRIAKKKSALISNFPFVRGVMISGSLSKGFMDEKSDIDYLIITKPGRLWIARTLLVIYKKIFLLNSHKFFCINYFLDFDNLQLNDRNLFTATELLYATPLYNQRLYNELLDKNEWVRSYYPSFIKQNKMIFAEPEKAGKIISFIEKVLRGSTGEWLDNFCLQLSTGFWKLKFKKMDQKQFHRDMKSNRGISKHHPNGFRDKILNEHKKRMDLFYNKIYRNEETFKTDAHQVINT